ncbi:HutD/Ves family protein [Derxia lacustris]|uniref:HutD/Ves family protein n=1 Tax=Derxia lacustris TaxID=764842 RepID=UPI000A16E15E|nr:HutD family protein [Derxia lacustris]
MTTALAMPPSLDHVRSYDLADLREEPWRNGGGITRTVAAGRFGAPDADDAEPDWRASIADILEDGAFSHFAGIDREAVLLAGPGLCLHAPDAALRFDSLGATHAFAGETTIRARLGSGPARLLNFMTRRGAARVRVDVLRDRPFASQPGSSWIVHAIAGRWQGDAARLGPGTGLVIAPGAARQLLLPVAPGALLVAARIQPA